jgi:RNA polymerase sigma-70 factor (sigma-E family)
VKPEPNECPACPVYRPDIVGPDVDPGDRSRLGELYRRHVPEMVRLAYIVTGDANVAEDLAQDAFVRVAGRFTHLRNEDAFRFYLRRALFNLCKNHFRHRDVERAFMRSQSTPEPHHPDSRVEAHELIRAALLRLPERQRAVIALRYFDDLSVEDTAEVLGCRPGTVKSLTSRALEALRGALKAAVDS